MSFNTFIEPQLLLMSSRKVTKKTTRSKKAQSNSESSEDAPQTKSWGEIAESMDAETSDNEEVTNSQAETSGDSGVPLVSLFGSKASKTDGRDKSQYREAFFDHEQFRFVGNHIKNALKGFDPEKIGSSDVKELSLFEMAQWIIYSSVMSYNRSGMEAGYGFYLSLTKTIKNQSYPRNGGSGSKRRHGGNGSKTRFDRNSKNRNHHATQLSGSFAFPPINKTEDMYSA